MATNGVYFGAEIVRDLTPAPSSRMVKRRRRRGERVEWGRVGRRSPRLGLPLSCFSHLHPSLSLSVHLSLCLLPLAGKPPPFMSVSSFPGRAPGLTALGPQEPLPEGGSSECCTLQEHSWGLQGTLEQILTVSQSGPQPAHLPAIAWGTFLSGHCSALAPKKHTP